MDIAWIQIFILTLSECVSPAGKTVCQEREFELQFVSQQDCQVALQQLVTLKSESEKVIVNAERSRCTPSARQQEIFANPDAVKVANRNTSGWRAPEIDTSIPEPSREVHNQRLANIKSCDDTAGSTPCKIGEIIIEGAGGKQVEVWRKNQ